MRLPLTHAARIAWLVGSLAACDRDGRSGATDHASYEPLVSFEAGAIRIETATDTFRLSAEIAEREDQRAYGLMERPSLPGDAGMMFVYAEPQDADAGFWMYRTLIPLDIAYLDANGRIVAIHAMRPCESSNPRLCRIYSPGVPYIGALEVNRGYLAQRGIGLGDRVVLERAGGNDRPWRPGSARSEHPGPPR